jgi:hypothetical protein
VSDDRHDRPDEFYVGYLPSAPPRLGCWLRPRVALVVLAGLALAPVLVASQRPFPPKVFEWGHVRTFVGVLREKPVPSLLVRRPGRAREDDAWTRHLLVAPGKFGADAEVEGRDGKLVELEGTLIYREDQTMIEVVAGSVKPLDGDDGGAPAAGRDLGRHTLVGEIVDSKCYLGVMAPGSTKPHRACATRCISGGIPPVLLVRQADGRALYLLLLDEDGSCVNDRVTSMIAEPVEIEGRVERHADLLVLEADPATYRRLAP